MSRDANAGLGPGAAQKSPWLDEPALDIKSDNEWQQAVVIRPGADNKSQYSRTVYSNRVRFIGTLGFRRRRRWLAPFTASIFQVERRELGAQP
jgi:hypothetical protein